MRVVILQRCIPHYRESLFRALNEAFGWEVVVAGNFPDDTFLSTRTAQLPYVHRYDYHFLVKGNPYRCRVPTARILGDLDPTAVISEFSLQMSSTYTLLARRVVRQGPPVYFWSHGFNMDRGLGPRGLVYQVPRVVLLKMADGHVVYSEEGRRFLERFIDPSRIAVVRNTVASTGLPGTESGPVARARRESPRGPSLLSIGRITRDKDFPALVRVFRGLVAALPEATLTIVGDGPDASRTRFEAGEMLGKRVFMPGSIHDEKELARRFEESDLALFCGAVGLSVNHALLHGVPVVAFDRTPRGPFHHPEIAYVINGVTGLRVSPYNEDAMVDALRNFLRLHPNPKNEFRKSIAGFVERELRIESMLSDFGRVRDMLARHGPGGSGVARRA